MRPDAPAGPPVGRRGIAVFAFAALLLGTGASLAARGPDAACGTGTACQHAQATDNRDGRYYDQQRAGEQQRQRQEMEADRYYRQQDEQQRTRDSQGLRDERYYERGRERPVAPEAVPR